MTTIREVSNTLRSQKDSSSQLILPSSGHADLKFVLPGLSAPPLTLKGKCGISNFLVFLLELFSQNSCNLCRFLSPPRLRTFTSHRRLAPNTSHTDFPITISVFNYNDSTVRQQRTLSHTRRFASVPTIYWKLMTPLSYRPSKKHIAAAFYTTPHRPGRLKTFGQGVSPERSRAVLVHCVWTTWVCEYVKACIHHCFLVFSVLSTLLSLSYQCKCFIFRKFSANRVQIVMDSFPRFSFPTSQSFFPFERTGLDFSGPFTSWMAEKLKSTVQTSLPAWLHALASLSPARTNFLNSFCWFISNIIHCSDLTTEQTSMELSENTRNS